MPLKSGFDSSTPTESISTPHSIVRYVARRKSVGSSTDGLVRQLQRFRRKIEARYKIETMILFGSRARGKTHRSSDVDLILVSPRFRRKNIAERASQLYLEWDVGLPVDLLCYTPEEFDDLARRPSLVREALSEGISIPA